MPPSIQVGLLGSARDLQRDLDRIATRADTNSADGLHYVLEETVLALLRAPEYWVYGHAETNNERGPRNAEAKFNEYEMEARGKFQEETLVNFGGRTKRSGGGGPAGAPAGRTPATEGRRTPGAGPEEERRGQERGGAANANANVRATDGVAGSNTITTGGISASGTVVKTTFSAKSRPPSK